MSANGIARAELSAFLTQLLVPGQFQDYGPNGLQIEGRDTVSKLAFAVSATADSVAKAIAWGADTLIVHHGLFWQFHGPRAITGSFAKRVKPLIQHEINLYGYHLPLDAHLEIGNAAGLARRLGLGELAAFALYKGSHLGCSGRLPEAIPAATLSARLQQVCDHQVLMSSPSPDTPVQSVGIVTGGGNRYWKEARAQGLDAFITGEMSEHDWNEAKEDGICYLAAGHHATERFGVLDLKDALERRFSGISCTFIDSENPA